MPLCSVLLQIKANTDERTIHVFLLPGLTEEPIANEGFIPGVAPQMGSQMGRFPVILFASRHVTNVNFPTVSVRLAALLAIGTSARDAALFLHSPI